MLLSASFQRVYLITAAALVSATPPNVNFELADTVTETVTLPHDTSTSGTVVAPKIVEVTTVALSTVTVFSSDVVTTAVAPTLAAEVPASLSGNATVGPFLTDGPVNATLDAVASSASATDADQSGSDEATSSASQATITGTKNSSAIAIDR